MDTFKELLFDLLSGRYDTFMYNKAGKRTINPEEASYFVLENGILFDASEDDDVYMYSPDNDLVKNNRELIKNARRLASRFGKGLFVRVAQKRVEKSKDSQEIKIAEEGRKSMAKRKRKLEFEVTPEIKRLASILLDLYRFSGGGRLPGELDENEFYIQAERLLNNKITRFPKAKELQTPNLTGLSDEAKNYALLHNYYASIAQLLNPIDDVILGNLASRMADHYYFKLEGMKTVMNENSPKFKALEKLLDSVAKRLNIKKPRLSNGTEGNGLNESFEKYRPEQIFARRRVAELLKEERKEKARWNLMAFKKHLKNLYFESLKKKFTPLAEKVALNYTNPTRLKRLVEGLNAKEKMALYEAVKEYYSAKVCKSLERVLAESKAAARRYGPSYSEKFLKKVSDISPRRLALAKAALMILQGIDPEEAIKRVGLPANEQTRRELKRAVELAKTLHPKDKYYALAAKHGLAENCGCCGYCHCPNEIGGLHYLTAIPPCDITNFITDVEKYLGPNAAEDVRRLTLELMPLEFADAKNLENIARFCKKSGYEHVANEIEDYLHCKVHGENEVN